MITGVKYGEGNHAYIKDIRHYKVHFNLNFIIGVCIGILICQLFFVSCLAYSQ
jgi:hypothetical protein